MKVAVISPYYKEPLEKLRRCHESVKSQGMALDHFMIADGHANRQVDRWDAIHVKLPIGTGDSGDTPRMIGMAMAAALDYDGYLFLDGDNWFEPGHVGQMIWGYEQTGAPVVTCPRILRRLDGSQLGICIESDGIAFNDFNCYFFRREALDLLSVLTFGHSTLSYFTDRRLWAHLQASGCTIARVSVPTVNYETTRVMHYQQMGEEPPPEARVTVYNKTENRCIVMTMEEYDALKLDPNITFGTVEEHLTPGRIGPESGNGLINTRVAPRAADVQFWSARGN